MEQSCRGQTFFGALLEGALWDEHVNVDQQTEGSADGMKSINDVHAGVRRH